MTDRKDGFMKDYKLIIFDVDGTLVETKSGATFRKSEDEQAAKNAGVAFMWADEFFADTK
jgi:FMN phosphatase YigB (HAD superfamily)